MKQLAMTQLAMPQLDMKQLTTRPILTILTMRVPPTTHAHHTHSAACLNHTQHL